MSTAEATTVAATDKPLTTYCVVLYIETEVYVEAANEEEAWTEAENWADDSFDGLLRVEVSEAVEEDE